MAAEETAGTLAIADPHGDVIKRLTLGERPHEVEVIPTHGLAPRFVATGKTPIRALRGLDDLVYVANV